MTAKYPDISVQIAGKSGTEVFAEIRERMTAAGATDVDQTAFTSDLNNAEGYNDQLRVCAEWVHVGKPG
jgi:hypothetical protein